MKKEITDNLEITHAELSVWDYDEKGNEYPVTYMICGHMFGKCFSAIITTKGLQEKYRLDWACIESDSAIHSSLVDALEDMDNAESIRELFKAYWADYKDEDSPYDYLGKRE